MTETPIRVAVVGHNPTTIWGMSASERTRRIAGAANIGFSDAEAPAPILLVNSGFAFDPPLLAFLARQPGTALIRDGRVVIAHAATEAQAAAIRAAILNDASLSAETGLTSIVHDDGFSLYNETLRKREHPFAMRLAPDTVAAIERASYYNAYKGVTDILTKYLWPEWALWLTRLAARAGITPNMVTAVGAICCILATLLFWEGRYWEGMALGLVFMVFDTVDGKLARCTITSSAWGNVFDHGIDLIHPPFWWFAWGVGLRAWGLALSPSAFTLVMAAILIGYGVQRLIEGAFIKRFGMHIHVWRKFDSDFRLITARRNPNMIILFASMLFARPDIGLIAVACWTVLSCLIHAVRLAQAEWDRRRGAPITSWLMG
ncbi:CDP-alcohol phosphatidyltransferase family protein [Flavisphingomonas formosensis]|uniref:CDP-alcohol phosphatidyltransferase family protein n=1 Tax=Flavisphingomonas formosensis TaxID=861534 RepID=UPI0012F9F7E5|nr:CDP-alcohol phosphatidyltransferase family protein [Sphingomonas formosensis]